MADAAYAASHRPDQRMRLEYREPAPHVTKLAYVSWAYLRLFAEFGYAFALSPPAQLIRQALVSGNDDKLGRAYWIRWGDLLTGTPEPIAVLQWERPTAGGSPSFLSLGVRVGDVGVLIPPASDAGGEIYRLADELLDEDRETDRLLPVPFWEWFGQPRRDFLDAGCQLWRRTAAGLTPLVFTTPAVAVAALREAQAPPFRARTPRRPTGGPPVVAPLPTTLGPTTWPGFAAHVLSTWWGRQPASGTRNLVLPGDGPSLIKAAAQIAPPYLVAHLEDIERIFGFGAAVDDTPQSALSTMDVLLDWAKQHGISIGDATITDEMIDTDRDIGQTWLWCRLDGDSLVIGPFYTRRTFLAAVRQCLDEWLTTTTSEPTTPATDGASQHTDVNGE